MNWLKTFSTRVNTFAAFLCGISILIMGLIVTYEVIMRFFFNSPTTWVGVVSTSLCVGSCLLSIGYIMKEKSHITVELVTDRLSERNKILFSLMGLILSTLYTFVFTWEGMKVTIETFKAGEVTNVLGIPMFILRGFVPMGGLLLLFELIYQIMADISKWRKAREKTPTSRITLTDKLAPLIFLALVITDIFLLRNKGLAPYGFTILLFVLIFAGIPIAFALGLLGLLGFYFTFGGGPILLHIPMVSFSILTDFMVVALPLFIMISSVLLAGGIGANLFEVASNFVRHLPGGLGVSTILACAIFAAISGSSTATCATIGLIAIPHMLSHGYGRKFVFGTAAVGGVLGPLIPPSMFMIVIGAITGDSIGKLFMAGMLPGIILAVVFSAYIVISSRNNPSMPKMDPVSWKERMKSLKNGFWGLMTPVIILGGIYTGIFTATEAAAVALTYGLIICGFVQRTLSWKKLGDVFLETARLSGMILFIMGSALVFGQAISLLDIPNLACNFLAGLPISQYTILYLVLLLILILGALMDEASILLITYPLLYEIFVKRFGFDSIWFAMVYVFTLEVGLIAPPVGINLFVVQGLDKTAKFEEVSKGALPYIILMILCIFLIVHIKPISTWLPSLMG
jgi:C4-dicarboxylate transporter DctM subunit